MNLNTFHWGSLDLKSNLCDLLHRHSIRAIDSFSPLHDAIDSNNMDIIRLLLSYGADISLETYSGIKSFQLARSIQVKEFLKGTLKKFSDFLPLQKYLDVACKSVK